MSTQMLYLSQIRTVLPSMPFETVEQSGGQFNDILVINQELVFRFPRYRDGVAKLIFETGLLDALRGKLPLPIPEPVYHAFEPPVPGLAFMGYRRLNGEPLETYVLEQVKDAFIRDDLARQLAAFLRALHGIPLTSLPQEVIQPGTVGDRREIWENMYAQVREKLFPAMRPSAQREIRVHFESYLDNATLHNFTPCLRHGDLGGSNILWDPQAGAVTGVIDFSFCGLGDPAMDLASVSTLGEDFFQRLFQRYAIEANERDILLARARFYRGLFALEEALDGLRYGDPEAYRHGMEAFIE